MRRAIVALIFLCAGAGTHAETVWLRNLPQGIAQARALSKPMFVDIMAPWCGFCRKMRQEVFPTRQFEEMSASFVLVRINAEEDLSVRKFNIQGFPTLLFLDRNGYLISRIDGFVELAQLLSVMRDALTRTNTEDKIVRQTREQPGVQSSYRAGLYYANVNDQEKARRYFLAAWESGRLTSDRTGYDSLYNAAVSSMELRDFAAAVKLWSEYLKAYPSRDSDFAYARYFRGLSLRSMGRLGEARDDISYAATYLPEGEEKQAAQRMAKVN